MSKQSFKPGDMLAPLPCIMATCSNGKEDNIITIAWTGIINSEPPMTYISVRPSRHSYKILQESKEFVINLANTDLVFALDYCGCKSGSKENKFENMHLTKAKADIVSCPMIAESPMNLECKVTSIQTLGSHDIFMAEIVAVHVDEKYISKSGRIAFEKMNLISYVHGDYYTIDTKRLGTFGYSVMKPKTTKRRISEGKPAKGNKPHWEKKEAKK